MQVGQARCGGGLVGFKGHNVARSQRPPLESEQRRATGVTEHARGRVTSLARATEQILKPRFAPNRIEPGIVGELRRAVITARNRRFDPIERGRGKSPSPSSVEPSTNSITRNSVASVDPMSYNVQMCGWLSAAIVLASCANRSRRCGSATKAGGRIFTATSRCWRMSEAR